MWDAIPPEPYEEQFKRFCERWQSREEHAIDLIGELLYYDEFEEIPLVRFQEAFQRRISYAEFRSISERVVRISQGEIPLETSFDNAIDSRLTWCGLLVTLEGEPFSSERPYDERFVIFANPIRTALSAPQKAVLSLGRTCGSKALPVQLTQQEDFRSKVDVYYKEDSDGKDGLGGDGFVKKYRLYGDGFELCRKLESILDHFSDADITLKEAITKILRLTDYAFHFKSKDVLCANCGSGISKKTLSKLYDYEAIAMRTWSFTPRFYCPECLTSLQHPDRTKLHPSDRKLLKKLEEKVGRSLPLINNNNELTPGFIVENGRVIVLHVRECTMGNLPDEIFEFESLRQLNVADNGLTSIPDSVSNLATLEVLYLNNNKLTSLPDSFADLEALEELYVCNNAFLDVPEPVFLLPSLRKICLEFNLLKTLPLERFASSTLKIVDAGCNAIWDFPTFVPESLSRLGLKRNYVETIPAGNTAPNLSHLDLSHNYVEEIPATLSRFPNLGSLDLSYNDVRTVSPDIEPMKKHFFLELKGNANLWHAPTFLESLGRLDLDTVENNHRKPYKF